MRNSARRAIAAAVLLGALLLAPNSARAQDTASRVWELARQVLIDPTTYAPAVISYEAAAWDWRTSQVLFAHGWVEANPRFTVSGRPNDTPITYLAGTRLIRGEALSVLKYSALNNVAAGISERMLAARYPAHRKLIRTVSWIERIGFASIITYHRSADHVRQGRANRRLAREHGYSP